MKTVTICIGMLVVYPMAFGFLAYGTLRSAHLGGEMTAVLSGLLAAFLTLACNVRDVWNIYAPVEDPQLQSKAPEVFFPAQLLTYLVVPVSVVMGHVIAAVLQLDLAWPPIVLGVLAFWGARAAAENFEGRGRYTGSMMTLTVAKHRHAKELKKRNKASKD